MNHLDIKQVILTTQGAVDIEVSTFVDMEDSIRQILDCSFVTEVCIILSGSDRQINIKMVGEL